MKKLVIILLVFVLLIGGGIYFILPSNINWDKYTQEISAEVRQATGVSFNVQGKSVFSMKPSPILKLGRVVIGNVQDGSYEQLMTAEGAEILLDTKALFRRQIKIKKITLTTPHFNFETLPNGKWNWQTAFFDRATSQTQIGFDSLLMTGGSIDVRTDKYTPPDKWQNLNAELFADSIQGPFFLEGNVGAVGSIFNFSFRVERFVPNMSPNFTLRVINAPSESTLSFTGIYGMTETDRGMLSGNMTYDIRKPDKIFSLFFPDNGLPLEIFQPIIGNLKLQKNALTRISDITDFVFKYGNSSATGKMNIRRLSSDEASSYLQTQPTVAEEEDDEDEIILRDPNNPGEAVTLDNIPVSQTNLAENLLPKVIKGSFIFSKFEADPFFNNIDKISKLLAETSYLGKTRDTFSIDVTFDTVDYKRDVINQMRLSLHSADKGLGLKNFAMTLPSGAYVSGEADMLFENKKVSLSGKSSVEADNIGAVLRWLGVPVPEEVPQNLLRRLNGSTEFKITDMGFSLSKTQMELDKIKLSGALSMRRGTRPAYGIVANVSEINPNLYFPEKSKLAVEKRAEFIQLPRREKIKQIYTTLAPFNEMDISLKLNTDNFYWADVRVDELSVDLSALRGQMQIKDLSAKKVFDASVSIQGLTSGFGGEPAFDGFQVKVDTMQLQSLVKGLGLDLPQGLSQDKLNALGTITGTFERYTFDSSANFGFMLMKVKGEGRQSAESGFLFNTQAEIKHDNFRNFVRLFSDKYRPALANPGALNFTGDISTAGKDIQVSNMTASVGSNTFTGDFKVERKEEGGSVLTATLGAKEITPLGLLPRLNFISDVTLSPNPQASFLNKDGVLSFLSLPLSFSKKPFDFSFLGGYEATVALKADKIVMNDLVLTDPDVVLTFSGNKLQLDLRQAVWEKANIVIRSAFIMETGGVVSTQTALRMSDVAVPARLFNSNLIDAGQIKGMTLSLNATGKGSNTSEWVSSIEARGNVSIDKLDLIGLDYRSGMKALQELQPETPGQFIMVSTAGTTPLSNFSAPISIKDGTLSVQPIKFSYADKVEENSFVTYRLPTAEFNMETTFNYDVPKTDPLHIKLIGKSGQEPEIQRNIQDQISGILAVKREVQAKQQEEKEKQQEAEDRIAAEERKRLLDILSKMNEQLSVGADELEKRIENLTQYKEKVYQVGRYYIDLEKDLHTLRLLGEEIKNAMARPDLQQMHVTPLEKRLNENLTAKASEFETKYNTALALGIKGMIFDMVTESNNILLQTAKARTQHPDLIEIPEVVNQLMRDIEELKSFQLKAEEQSHISQQVITLAEGEVVFEKIKAAGEKVEKSIKEKNDKIATEEAAKKAAEEAKRKAEEEAKKAAEEAEAADKARKEAEEKERQRTIRRRDDPIVSTGTSSSSGASSVSLQPLTPAEQEPVSTEAPEAKKPTIIRRR